MPEHKHSSNQEALLKSELGDETDLDLSGNTVLVTGGATGIGYALAKEFAEAGSQVIICGRRKSKLQTAERQLLSLKVKRCDVAVESERRSLLKWTTTHFPGLNVLVNNAGIQRKVDFTSPRISKIISSTDDEVTINLSSQIRLCALFTPHLLKKENALILNISSGLAFVPIASMPVYCATKAAIHSFTTSLRHQLRNTRVRVIEAVPPATDTELDASFAGPEENAYRGISPREVASAIMEGLQAGREEIFVGDAERFYQASLQDPKSIFNKLNG